MKSINEYIDICKESKGFEKDAEMARFFGITTAGMTRIRKGGALNDSNLMKLRQALHLPIEELLLANIATREKNPIFKKAWEKISQQTGIAAGFLFVIQAITPFKAVFNSVECILC